MSNVVDQAAAAAPLELKDSNPALFLLRDQKMVPVTVTLPGNSNISNGLFHVTATGKAKAAAPGTLILTLYGKASLNASLDPNTWLPLSSTPAEPIGGSTDLPEALFMLQGSDLLVNVYTGKMQGTFKSNVASNPQAAADLEQHPGDITEADPVYVFAIGASFTPTGDIRKVPLGRAADAPPICTLTLGGFTLTA